jgi:hypothetical protein
LICLMLLWNRFYCVYSAVYILVYPFIRFGHYFGRVGIRLKVFSLCKQWIFEYKIQIKIKMPTIFFNFVDFLIIFWRKLDKNDAFSGKIKLWIKSVDPILLPIYLISQSYQYFLWFNLVLALGQTRSDLFWSLNV